MDGENRRFDHLLHNIFDSIFSVKSILNPDVTDIRLERDASSAG